MAQASILEQFNAPLQLREFPVPTRMEEGAVLIRTEMAGICGTDVHLWKGELPIKLPLILGHETVGRIEQLGAGMEKDWTGQPLRVGDRVAWNSSVSCGRCFYCVDKQQPTRCPERRAYGIGYPCDQPPHWLGGYAQHHYLHPGATIFRLPDEVSNESLIGAGCALITAIHGIERLCHPQHESARTAEGQTTRRPRMPMLPDLWRDTVVIQGAGPVGIAALAVARKAGARKVIVVGGPIHRLAMAKRFGADHTIDLQEVTAPAQRVADVKNLCGGYGADIVLECVGHPSAVGEGMEMCRDGGKYLVLGHYCDAGPVSWNPHVVTRKQLEVHGSWSSEPRHLKAAIDFLGATARDFPFAAMVTHRFSLHQANEALATTATWQAAKSVLLPNG